MPLSPATSRYEPGSLQRRLWCTLPIGEFVRIDELSSFDLHHATVLFRIKNPVDSIVMEEKPLGPLPFGVIVAVTCASLVVAYQITVPHCQAICVGTNYASFARKKNPSTEVQTYVVDRRIAVVGNADALLAASNVIRWIGS